MLFDGQVSLPMLLCGDGSMVQSEVFHGTLGGRILSCYRMQGLEVFFQ